MEKHEIETMTAAFFYDRAGNLVGSCIVEADLQSDGVAFSTNGFATGSTSKQMLDSLKGIAGVEQVLGWLCSSSGRTRCFVVPPTKISAGDLLRYLESIEKHFFKRHPEAAAFEIKPSATKS